MKRPINHTDVADARREKVRTYSLAQNWCVQKLFPRTTERVVDCGGRPMCVHLLICLLRGYKLSLKCGFWRRSGSWNCLDWVLKRFLLRNCLFFVASEIKQTRQRSDNGHYFKAITSGHDVLYWEWHLNYQLEILRRYCRSSGTIFHVRDLYNS